MTIERKNIVNGDCTARVCRSSVGIDAAAQGTTLSLISTATFVTGLVGLGVGGYLVITGGSKSTPAVALAPTITRETSGLQIMGSF
jgi:hypothetical protein